MSTTLTELGQMLIEVGTNGRVLECRNPSLEKDRFYRCSMTNFNIHSYEYRLKPVPKITYYRVYEDYESGTEVMKSSVPFGKNATILGQKETIKDFQIEE